MRRLARLSFILTLLALPAQAGTYPLTIDNCGQTITLDAAPERVVTIKSTATEMLLSLGLGDKIVRVGFQEIRQLHEVTVGIENQPFSCICHATLLLHP